MEDLHVFGKQRKTKENAWNRKAHIPFFSLFIYYLSHSKYNKSLPIRVLAVGWFWPVGNPSLKLNPIALMEKNIICVVKKNKSTIITKHANRNKI